MNKIVLGKNEWLIMANSLEPVWQIWFQSTITHSEPNTFWIDKILHYRWFFNIVTALLKFHISPFFLRVSYRVEPKRNRNIWGGKTFLLSWLIKITIHIHYSPSGNGKCYIYEEKCKYTKLSLERKNLDDYKNNLDS